MVISRSERKVCGGNALKPGTDFMLTFFSLPYQTVYSFVLFSGDRDHAAGAEGFGADLEDDPHLPTFVF
jgi:hypothetical protein